MRDIPEEMVARIESGAAMLCHVWLLRRADATVMGFTDHDRDLTLDGVVCRAGSGWTAGAMETATGLAPGETAAAGGLGDDAITEADVEAGLYDGASVELWRVDWTTPALKVRLAVATVTRIRREGDGFTAELAGPLEGLEAVIGRTYGRDCDARLGDDRCQVSLTSLPGAVCDKRWRTCVGVFGNGANFRGFPDIPGDDFLTAWPVEGGRHDGGSRR
jgi:hypothetical protein